MKKLLTLVLLAVLCMTLASPALAAKAALSSTKSFLDMMELRGYTCENYGLDEEGDEMVLLRNPDSDIPYSIVLFFDSDLQHTTIFVWNVIDFDPEDTLRVMLMCNKLNYTYNTICWYVDESDYSVTCSVNLIYRDDNVGLVNAEAVAGIVTILRDAYPRLSVYAK